MPPAYFPLRWESTGEQWWYAAPIDCAAANGHYDLVRQLLRLDNNHLFKLTSLRRIRRLETVWDDEEQFHDVAKCRFEVARKLHLECEIKGGKNSLLQAGYGGWLLYTAASAGDVEFVQELLRREPLLVFGEGEFGVTDLFYAAARSKNSDVFRLLFDFAVSPRFAGKRGVCEEHIGEIPSVFKLEMMTRAVHAAARGGNSEILKELLNDCTSSNVLSFRDIQGSTILHAAAGRGQVEVVKYLIDTFHIINSTDNQGNTALHIAASRGQLSVVEALIVASPSSISSKNNAGETFLHMAVSGFQTPAFRRIDKQVKLMKQLVRGKVFNLEKIINYKNNDGRTALHMAIIGNMHSELVQLLMTVRTINVNVRDVNIMTPLDILKQRPRSASSEMLCTQLVLAGGMFSCHDYTARRSMVSQLKMHGNGNSPGTSFRINDSEIFLYTGLKTKVDTTAGHASRGGKSFDSIHLSEFDTSNENQSSHTNHSMSDDKRKGAVKYAAKGLKRLLQWHRVKEKNTTEKLKKMDEEMSVKTSSAKWTNSEETPIPLRQRFSKPSSLANNKRALAVRTNLPSPMAKKKFASGVKHGVLEAMPHLTTPRRSHSSSMSSLGSQGKQKDVYVETNYTETERASCSSQSQMFDDGTPNFVQTYGGSRNKKLVNQYLCFGTPASVSVKDPPNRMEQNQNYKNYVLSVA